MTKRNISTNIWLKIYIYWEANTINQSEPEGKSNHQKGEFVTLAPEGVEYRSNIIINDESIFWQKSGVIIIAAKIFLKIIFPQKFAHLKKA